MPRENQENLDEQDQQREQREHLIKLVDGFLSIFNPPSLLYGQT